jgi:uncharacterized protein
MKCGETVVGFSIEVAATFGKRFMGLMFRKSLPQGAGLLLLPCGSIHMCFMRMPLDIVYMDGRFRVLAVQKGLKPWLPGAFVKGAKQVLELPAGTADRCCIEPGMLLTVEQPALPGIVSSEEKRGIHGYKEASKCAQY